MRTQILSRLLWSNSKYKGNATYSQGYKIVITEDDIKNVKHVQHFFLQV